MVGRLSESLRWRAKGVKTSIITRIDQSLLDILYQELGTDDDEIEREAYRLNPHLALLPSILPSGTVIQLPNSQPTKTQRPQQFWD